MSVAEAKKVLKNKSKNELVKIVMGLLAQQHSLEQTLEKLLQKDANEKETEKTI